MIHYRAGYKYQLAKDYNHALPAEFKAYTINTRFFTFSGGVLAIYAGYAWDGASGPTWDSKCSMRASLIHDCLYQAMRMGFIAASRRDAADQEFHRICLEDGMLKPRAWLWYQAVSRFGAANVSPDNRREVMVAGA